MNKFNVNKLDGGLFLGNSFLKFPSIPQNFLKMENFVKFREMSQNLGNQISQK